MAALRNCRLGTERHPSLRLMLGASQDDLAVSYIGETNLRVLRARRQVVDVKLSRRGKGFRVIRVERNGVGQGSLGFLFAIQTDERQGAIVVCLDRLLVLAERFLGAGQSFPERSARVGCTRFVDADAWLFSCLFQSFRCAIEQRLNRSRGR